MCTIVALCAIAKRDLEEMVSSKAILVLKGLGREV